MMTPDEAAWVYERVICDYHLANENTWNDPDQTDGRLTCACQIPCSWCRNGQHDTCRRFEAGQAREAQQTQQTQDTGDSGTPAPLRPPGYGPETHLRAPAPWRPSTPKRPLHVKVWLADRVCRYLCNCATCTRPTAPPAPRHPVPDHIPERLREAFATTRGRQIPPHSPYQLGDAVQLHGYSGEHTLMRRTGFRGWVVGCVGSTVLTGITTDGEEWWEYWGRLKPDGQPVDLWSGCACCREARRPLLRAFYANQRAAGEQLDLFGAAP